MRKKSVFNWSGGKDSALALYQLLQNPEYEVVSLLTTLNGGNRRSSMHAIPLDLLRQQADSIGLPLYTVDVSAGSDFSGYETAMERAVSHFRAEGVTHFVFGDIFLHDVRSYREKQLAAQGIQVVEPLWGRSSARIMEEFCDSGLQTLIVCITESMLPETFLGRVLDRKTFADLPPEADLCGENGEYHTFCYGGPLFKKKIRFSTAGKIRISNKIRLDSGVEQEYVYHYLQLVGDGG